MEYFIFEILFFIILSQNTFINRSNSGEYEELVEAFRKIIFKSSKQ